VLRIANNRYSLLITVACATLLAAGCGGKSSTGAVCGDGVVEGSEACDDGNTINGDGCSSVCTVEGTQCGNGIIEAGEECDDANTVDGDGCSSVCSLEVAPGCGNGVVEIGEGCDDGNTVACDGCSATCSMEVCGNNVTECAEECDDGNTTPGDGCDADCMVEVTPDCGDGDIDAGEECDDGNTTPGDGCDADCMLEVAPGCGNGVVEVGEDCDDGNTTDCDGCSATCADEVCGNGVVECAEECDDGNTTPGDGCDATCNTEGTPVCGNGVLEAGEGCDDGDTTDCDGCSATCTVEECGNNVTECAEECDDGNLVDGDGCSATCLTEIVPTCGNGTVEAGEECDDGNTLNTDACLNNCADATCGDNFLWAGTEGCDDGNLIDGDGCSSTCQLEACGNGVVDSGEGCDDGNGDNTDACPDGVGGTCEPAICGDGFIHATVEECDDGGTANGDGCSSTCAIETPECLDAWTLTCGDSDSWNNGGFGSTDVIDTYSCSGWDESGPEYTYLFIAAASENVTIGLSAMAVDLDIFVIDDQGGVCDPTNCLDVGETSVTFAAVAGTTYYLVVDGYLGAVGDYTATLVCPSTPGCGDGTVDMGEDCDDGNFDDTDACVTGCVNASCGDGYLHAGVEDCDDGNANNDDGCRNDCTIPACGDGILDTGEECDDGNVTDLDGCSAACVLEPCDQDQWPLTCGGSDTYNNSWGMSPTNLISTYSCAAWDESGPEYTYLFTAANGGVVILDLTVNTAGEDLDVFVITQSNGQCSPTDCLTYGDSQAAFLAVAGETYYIIVDGFGGSIADYTIDMTCNCGNGTLDFGEECDDGNSASGDGCDANCEREGVLCEPDFVLACGGTDTWSNLGGGHTNNVASYSCNTWNESGPEYTYLFNPVNAGDVTVDLSGMTEDLDIYILSDGGMVCDPSNCLDYGNDTVTFTATAGGVYFLVVDGFDGAVSDYTIDVTCTNP